jgi:hypothetical protein
MLREREMYIDIYIHTEAHDVGFGFELSASDGLKALDFWLQHSTFRIRPELTSCLNSRTRLYISSQISSYGTPASFQSVAQLILRKTDEGNDRKPQPTELSPELHDSSA